MYEKVMEDIGNAYVKEIEWDVKNNPNKLVPGMFVAVYGEHISANERLFHGYGIVLTNEWSEGNKEHLYEVEMFHTRDIHLFSGNDLCRYSFIKPETSITLKDWRYNVREGTGHDTPLPKARLDRFEKYRNGKNIGKTL